MAKIKAPQKIRVPRTRNAGTMTEQQFWRSIYVVLRRRSMFWKPTVEVRNEARRPNQSDNKKLKWEYQCSKCKQWFPFTEIVVDHIHGTGGLTSGAQLHDFVENLFCEKDKLRVLCNVTCHNKTGVTLDQ